MALTPEQLLQARNNYLGMTPPYAAPNTPGVAPIGVMTPEIQPIEAPVVEAVPQPDPAAQNLVRDPAAAGLAPEQGLIRDPVQAGLEAVGGGVAETPVAPPAAAPEAGQSTEPVEPATEPKNDLPIPGNFSEAIGNYSTASQVAADAIRTDAEVKAQALEQQAAVEQQQAQELALRQQAFEAEQAERAKVREETMAEFKQLSDQATNLQAKDSRTTGQRVMGVLAVALAGLGDAFSRMGGQTSNYAGAVQAGIDRQIERDLDAQREAINGKRQAAAMKLTELGLARQQFTDAQDAEKFAESQISLRYATQLRATAAKSNSEVAKSAAEVTASALEAKANGEIAELMNRRDAQKMRSRLMDGQKSAAGGGGALSATDLLDKLDKGLPMSKKEMDYALKLDAARDRDAAREDRAENAEKNRASKPAPGEKPEPEGVMKARALIKSSERPAAAVEQFLKSGDSLPGYISANSPDALAGDKAALYWGNVDSVARDLLRYESGASISTEETEGLIARSKSSSEAVRRQAVQRLLDKRNAIMESLPKRAPVQGPTATYQHQSNAGVVTGPRVRFQIGDTVGSVPAEQAEAFQKKYPNAKRL